MLLKGPPTEIQIQFVFSILHSLFLPLCPLPKYKIFPPASEKSYEINSLTLRGLGLLWLPSQMSLLERQEKRENLKRSKGRVYEEIENITECENSQFPSNHNRGESS